MKMAIKRKGATKTHRILQNNVRDEMVYIMMSNRNVLNQVFTEHCRLYTEATTQYFARTQITESVQAGIECANHLSGGLRHAR